jgi:hypothetical protein
MSCEVCEFIAIGLLIDANLLLSTKAQGLLGGRLVRIAFAKSPGGRVQITPLQSYSFVSWIMRIAFDNHSFSFCLAMNCRGDPHDCFVGINSQLDLLRLSVALCAFGNYQGMLIS